jgi:hypothetical protein
MSSRTTIYYDAITATGRKRGECVVCGKNAQRAKTFQMTANPWNRNEDGTRRTRAEIQRLVNQQAVAWEAEPIMHGRCES